MGTYSRMTDMTDHLNKAFQEEIKDQLLRSLEKTVEEFKTRLPEMVARASSMIDVQLTQLPQMRGLEVSFTIRDMESIKKEFNNS